MNNKQIDNLFICICFLYIFIWVIILKYVFSKPAYEKYPFGNI